MMLPLEMTPNGNLTKVVVSSTAVVLPQKIPDNKTGYLGMALVGVTGAAIYATFDGTDPVADGTNGILFAAGYSDLWHASMVNAAKFIRATGTDGRVNAQPVLVRS